MAQYWKITEAIGDAIDQATEAGAQAAADWTGSAQEDQNEYASRVYTETDTAPDDKPITPAQDDAIRAVAAELTEQSAAWLAANPAETDN